MPTSNKYPFTFCEPEWLDEVGSTSTFLRERQGARLDPSGTVVAAKTQTAGRGRMGNTWYSLPGQDLMFSFLLRETIHLAEAGTLSLVCALGVADFLQSRGIHPSCKWPNDLLVNGRKITGILAESRMVEGKMEIVVGIGVNLRKNPERDKATVKPTTSLEDEKVDGCLDAVTLLPIQLAYLRTRVNDWLQDGFSKLYENYSAMLWGVGMQTVVRTERGILEGVILGVNSCGMLRLLLPDGNEKIISSCVSLEPK